MGINNRGLFFDVRLRVVSGKDLGFLGFCGKVRGNYFRCSGRVGRRIFRERRGFWRGGGKVVGFFFFRGKK